jgi:hypothetical protein
VPKKILNPYIPRAGPSLDGFIEQYELNIREWLIAKSGLSRFSSRRLYERYRSRAKKLRKTGKKPANHLHPSFASLDKERRSAACPFEAIRLRLWLLTQVRHTLLPDDSYLITLADPKWSRPLEELSPDWYMPVLRKIRAAVATLQKASRPVKGVAVIELCVDRDLDGNLSWSPHFHMVITGADRVVLRKAFDVRLPAGRRGIDKPLLVKLIKPGDLGRVLSYISKMKPELRSAYMTKKGRKRRRRNHLPKELLPDWLSVMAERPITELVVHFGQGPNIARRFRTAEMSFILGELL